MLQRGIASNTTNGRRHVPRRPHARGTPISHRGGHIAPGSIAQTLSMGDLRDRG